MTDPLRIAVAIASRGRPSALVGSAMAAWRLQSGQHHIAFPVAIDSDDIPTQTILALAARDEAPFVVNVADRAPYLGAAQNRAIQSAQDADLTTLLTDRTYIITPGWDSIIVEAAQSHPHRILWWSSPHDADTIIPIIPRSYLEALDWQYSPERFPFWFDDTWHMEIDRMVFSSPSLKVRASYSGARAKTTRLRDLAFWAGLFAALRPRRVDLAKQVATKLGLEWKEPPADMLADFAQRDAYLLENAAKLEEAFGDARDPGPEYAVAKNRAEVTMREIAA